MRGNEVAKFNTWYVDRLEDGWSSPQLADGKLNSDSTEIFVSMAKNKNAYFVSERFGKRIIVRSRFENGEYQIPEQIELRLNGQVVYASNPCISADENFLIVSSRYDKESQPDLFISWNKNGKWTDLKNLGALVNTSMHAEYAPALSKNNKVLYFTSDRPGIVQHNRENARPPSDLYQISLGPHSEKLFP